MRKYLAVAMALSSAVSAAGKKKPPKPPDPVLCGIKAVFITGNNGGAYYLRKFWFKYTGITVVNSADQADAVMEVDQRMVSVPSWPSPVELIPEISVLLKDKAGKQLWTDTGDAPHGPGDVGGAGRVVIFDFNKSASCGGK